MEQPSGSSEVNGLQVSSLAESTKSVGEQGRKIYGQYMDLQPAIGETPKDSNAPLNRNYRCPNCEKTYHDDQRSFWARHWNEREKRCIACTQDQPNAAHDDATVPSSSASKLNLIQSVIMLLMIVYIIIITRACMNNYPCIHNDY